MAYARFVQSFLQSFSDLRPTIEEYFTNAEETKQVILWNATGNHTGTFRGVAPTGKIIRLGEYHVQYVQEGKIISSWTGP